MSVATETDLRAVAQRGAEELGPDATAEQVLAWTAETFGERLVVASNMQDAVLVDLAAQARPGVDVLFLDTGYHFAETIGTRDAVEAVYDVTDRQRHAGAHASTSRTRYWARTCSPATRTSAARCARSSRCRRRWPATTPGSPACAASRLRPGRTPRS